MLISISKKKAIGSQIEISTFQLTNYSKKKLLKSDFSLLKFAKLLSLHHAIMFF